MMTNLVPGDSFGSILMLPPWAMTIFFTAERPSPMPPGLWAVGLTRRTGDDSMNARLRSRMAINGLILLALVSTHAAAAATAQPPLRALPRHSDTLPPQPRGGAGHRRRTTH